MTPEEIIKGEFDIEIPNFKKWNPDTRFHRSWFALSTNFYQDPKIMQLTALEERLWIRLLCLRSRSEGALRGLRLASLRALVPLAGASMGASILKLLKLQLIDLRCKPLHNITIHNSTNTGGEKINEPAPIPQIMPVVTTTVIGSPSALPTVSPLGKALKSVGRKRQESNADCQKLIAHYCERYKSCYGTNPIIDGKTAGLAKQLLHHVSLDKARDLIEAYLQMKDPWFMKKCHDFITFVTNLNAVAVALANGTEDPQERNFWKKIWGDEGGKSIVRAANRTS